MMHWQDEGIMLARQPLGGGRWLVACLTLEHGLVRGVWRSRQEHLGLMDTGALVGVVARARLAEHLPTLQLEVNAVPLAAHLADSLRLAAVASGCQLILHTLPEREAHPLLATALRDWLRHLSSSDWLVGYARLEWQLLGELGYALDVSACALTGATAGLAYVSPKTGRAVTAAAAAPWQDKLLLLPDFLINNTQASRAEILPALRLTGYFLEQRLTDAISRPLPPARAHFVALVARHLQSTVAQLLEKGYVREQMEQDYVG